MMSSCGMSAEIFARHVANRFLDGAFGIQSLQVDAMVVRENFG
jgi:hypothetical protein